MNVIVILCDTLRRDHCEPYNMGKPLNEYWNREAPAWSVPTPNINRLAERGIIFDNAYCGSHASMPARRDMYTGRYEFLERGWGPLEDDDEDLPSMVSGPRPTRSIKQMLEEGRSISYLVTDHLNFWVKGSGNYHMGYTGFEFIRGNQEDPWYTSPADGFFCPEGERMSKLERYFRNTHHIRQSEADYPCARVFSKASEWLERNHTYDNFYLNIDSFEPHEPWDPPEELVRMFDPKGYDVEDWRSHPPYTFWKESINEEQFNSFRARYAADVVLVDRWLGKFLDTMDRLDLWRNTLVIFISDHGTHNGDHGRIGKGGMYQYDGISHIPFIAAHPELGHGERRSQLVEIVDIYPTVLAATGHPIPENRHGIDLLPALADAGAKTRDYAIVGSFGSNVMITDGDWVLHQAPVETNKPLYWYGHYLAKFGRNTPLGPYINGRREVESRSRQRQTWLSDKQSDPGELVNLVDKCPDKLLEMRQALKRTLLALNAPEEQFERLGLQSV